jgi:hybrid polyketide synthase/nonribosomal peptide synthetase ACE1
VLIFAVAALRCIELLNTAKRENIANGVDVNDKLQWILEVKSRVVKKRAHMPTRH